MGGIMLHEDSADARAQSRADALYLRLNNESWTDEEGCSRVSNGITKVENMRLKRFLATTFDALPKCFLDSTTAGATSLDICCVCFTQL